ncbi:MAG: TetR/AcrR family transcriptional regulator [Deltaproteobacteria bacterium]|nr:TetR/AcrR family transcriptional regulator [Deltaproteobacteria bacterium]
MPEKPRRYHHGDLRQGLVDTVLAMVAERGDASEVTLREVARRAGVSHNAPYRHFEDKEALLAAVATDGFALLATELRAAREGVADGEERFVRTGQAYLRFAREHRGYLALMHGPDVAKSRTPALQKAANDTFQILKDVAFDARDVEVVEARRVGTIAWSFLYGLATLSSNGQIPPSVGASAETLVEIGARHMYRAFRIARDPSG